ncbi:MAG: transglycosylase SLT domain-containing protein [Desulfobacteraceae bacterium]
MQKAPFRPLALIVAIVAGISFNSYPAAAEPFPQYDNIQPNVTFWIMAYSKYSTQQAVVHDSRHLDIIYDVIDLKPHDAYRARKINRSRMKRARAKYEKILKHLAANPASKNHTARQVAELFGPGASAKTFRRAARRVRCQIGQKDRFKAGLVRSGAFIDRIRQIFVANGLPVELAYLPHVESSFNYQAYSKFGAAGIWQFTRSTGKRFMDVGYVLDERRDPLSATHAAVALLKENYEKLGSWPLAITAYNHGASGMERAKHKFGDYPSIFDHYRSRTFKFASRNFYSEFLAAVHVASNYQDYFGELVLDRPLPIRTVKLEAFADFEDLCRHYGVSAEMAKSLNPALRPPVFNGQKYVPKGYTFRLPAGFEVASAVDALPSALYKHRQKPSRFYTVQRGDTAGRIARSHGVKLSDLILANNLGRRATIFPRQTLRIPVHRASPVPTKIQPPEPETSGPVLLAKTEPPEHKKPEPASLDKAGLSEHEKSEPVSLAEAEPPEHEKSEPVSLAEAEPLEPEKSEPVSLAKAGLPEPGKKDKAPAEPVTKYPEPVLASVIPTSIPKVVPLSGHEDSLPADEQVPSAEVVSVDVRFTGFHPHPKRPTGTLQVEVEETLGHFAEWAGVRTQEIRRLNGLPFGQTLHLHQRVKIPLRRVSAQVFEEQRYEYHKRLQEDFFAVYRISELRAYHVQRGDNLWTLGLNKFDIPMWLLKNCNPEIDFADLRMQQKLMVPIIEKQDMDAPEMDTESEPDEVEEQEVPNSIL